MGPLGRQIATETKGPEWARRQSLESKCPDKGPKSGWKACPIQGARRISREV